MIYPAEQMLFLSEQDVLALFTPADAIALTEDTFYHIGTGEVTVGEMALMYVDDGQKNNFHSMPAILRHRKVAGVKWIDTYADPLPGFPFSHGNLVLLSDTRTGSPIAVVGATNITNMRTAGGHGVVQARHLSNPEPAVLSVFGCGAQAQAGIRGFLEGFPSLKRIRLFSRSRPPMEAVQRHWQDQDGFVLSAAVADFTPEHTAAQKIKKDGQSQRSLSLVSTQDILAWLGEHKKQGQRLCGFSMETENLLENSRKKLEKKKADLIAANSLTQPGAGFGVDTNCLTLIGPDWEEALPLMSKEDCAAALLDKLLGDPA